MRIPRKIHFIWAGGDTEMPKKYEASVHLWHQQNPNYEIWMWIDKKSSVNPEFCRDSDESYFKKTFGNIVQLKDIEEENIADEYIRYEIEKPKPNYGASSDLLRYKILFEYGGAYFDFDITPGNTSLNDSVIFNTDFDVPVLYTHKSQNTDFEGNDAFICAPKNPLMLEMYKIAIGHYTLRYNKNLLPADNEIYNVMDFNSPEMIAYYYEDTNYIRNSTPVRTGPLCTRLVTRHAPHNVSLDKDCCNFIKYKKTYNVIANMNSMPLNNCFLYMAIVTKPFDKNGETWIENKFIRIDLKELINRITNTIKFEFEKLGILRLDDHVNHIKKTFMKHLKYSDEDKNSLRLLNKSDLNFHAETHAVNHVLKIIGDLNLNGLLAVQLTFQHQGTIDFCVHNQLLEKTLLFPMSKQCEEIIIMVPYYRRALYAVMRVNAYSALLDALYDQEIPSNEIYAEIENTVLLGFKFLKFSFSFSHFYLEETTDVDLADFSNYFDEIINIIDMILSKLDFINNKFDFPQCASSIAEFREWKMNFTSFRSVAPAFLAEESNLKSHSKEIHISPFGLFYQNKISIYNRQNKIANDNNFSNSEFKSAYN